MAAATASAWGQSRSGGWLGRAAQAARGASPAARCRRNEGPAGYAVHGPRRGLSERLDVGRRRRQGSLGRGVPRRDGQAQHVAQHPGIPLRRGAADGQDLRCQDRFRADHPAQRGQRAAMHPMREPLHDEPVDVAAGEADPHARARHGLLAKLGRDGILEGPVQMGQPAVDDDRRDQSLRALGGDHPLNLARVADTGARADCPLPWLLQRSSMGAPGPADRASLQLRVTSGASSACAKATYAASGHSAPSSGSKPLGHSSHFSHSPATVFRINHRIRSSIWKTVVDQARCARCAR